MEGFQDLLSGGFSVTILGAGGGGLVAFLLYISDTIRRIVFRTIFTMILTTILLYAGLNWMGLDLAQGKDLTAEKKARQEVAIAWLERVEKLWKPANDE